MYVMLHVYFEVPEADLSFKEALKNSLKLNISSLVNAVESTMKCYGLTKGPHRMST